MSPRAEVNVVYKDGKAVVRAEHPDPAVNIAATTALDLPVTEQELADAYDFLALEIKDLSGQEWGAWTTSQMVRFVEGGGHNCPHCGHNVLARIYWKRDPSMKIRTSCQGCFRAWMETYELRQVQPIIGQENYA